MRIVSGTISHHRSKKSGTGTPPVPELGTVELLARAHRWSTRNTLSFPTTIMGPSRTARLYFLLVLDLIFFVLEITIGQSYSPSFRFRHLFIPYTQVTLLALSRSSQTASTCSSIPISLLFFSSLLISPPRSAM